MGNYCLYRDPTTGAFPALRLIVNTTASFVFSCIYYGEVRKTPLLFKHAALGEGWQRHRIATVRWRLFQVPGRLIRHAGAWVLKVAATVAEDFAAIRSRTYAMHDPAPG